MPLELQIIRAREFVRLGAKGRFDLAASKTALATLVGACRKRGINQALMDLRELQPGPKPVFTRADLIELVATFRQIGFTQQQRLAVVYHSDPHRRARQFVFLSKRHGWTVQAFDNFEAAMLWLSGGEEISAPTRRSPAGKSLPISAFTAAPATVKSVLTIKNISAAKPGTRPAPVAKPGRKIIS